MVFYKNTRFIQLNNNLIILIQWTEKKISIISIYINDFYIASNIMTFLEELKRYFIKKYNTKNLGKMITITRWQIKRVIILGTIKID